MAPMMPVQYTARDGLTIHGYLTLPAGSDGKNLPVVINLTEVRGHGTPGASTERCSFLPTGAWRFSR